LRYITIGILGIISVMLYSCANELPPPGGDEDLTPPVVVNISPRPNSVNFSGNTIRIEFDEYIDRRSFQDALFISPTPKSEIEINYGGKDVEIVFTEGLEPNRTYTIYVGKELKDVRRGNKLNEPIQFAISTGPKLDKGKLSGKVYSEEYTGVVILAYKLQGNAEPDPETEVADFISQVNIDGNFSFLNLPEGNYRIFALRDDDRNLLLNNEFDKIYMTTGDHEVSDTKEVRGVDFLMEEFAPEIGDNEFYSLLNPDTANSIYTSIPKTRSEIPPDYTFYFYFPGGKLSRTDVTENVTVKDSASGQTYRPVFNWLNDSLLEMFFTDKFAYGSSIQIDFNLLNTSLKYFYSVQFSVLEQSSAGKVNGSVRNTYDPGHSAVVKLYNNNNKFINYTTAVRGDSTFSFPIVAEGIYTMFSFIDSDDNGRYSGGEVKPFKPAEKFIVYSKDMKVRGTWSVDNVFLTF
jgi:hypothetical protein